MVIFFLWFHVVPQYYCYTRKLVSELLRLWSPFVALKHACLKLSCVLRQREMLYVGIGRDVFQY